MQGSRECKGKLDKGTLHANARLMGDLVIWRDRDRKHSEKIILGRLRSVVWFCGINERNENDKRNENEGN